MNDTPRTDAQHAKWRIDDDPYTSMAEFARQLERELAACDACRLLELKAAERAGVDAARWGIASEYMTAHNRSIVEGLIPEILPAEEEDFQPYAAPQGSVTETAKEPEGPPVASALPRLHIDQHIGNPGVLQRAAYAAPQASSGPGFDLAGRSAEPAASAPFDPNVRLYAALNLLEQVYDEMQLQGWAMDGQWATATKKVLDEHGWSA